MATISGQLILLIYGIALLSGIIALVRFSTLHSLYKIPIFKRYVAFLYSYTIMIVCSVASLYMETNVVSTPLFYNIAEIGIILSAHLLALSLPAFLDTAIGEISSETTKMQKPLVCTTLPLSLVLYSVGYTSMSIVLALILFASILAITFVKLQAKKVTIPTPIQKRIKLFLIIIVLGFMAELLLYHFFPAQREFSLAMPLIYLSWNSISLSVINKPEKSSSLIEFLDLTEQEKKIVKLIEKAQSNKEIGEQLHISPHTVKNHITAIFRKTGFTNRVELMKYLQEVQSF